MDLIVLQQKLDEIHCPGCGVGKSLQAILQCVSRDACQAMCLCSSCELRFLLDVNEEDLQHKEAVLYCDVTSLTCVAKLRPTG